MYTLAIQSFGRENEYKRAILTILSYFSFTSLPFDKTRVLLFTDNPSCFSGYLDGLSVEYIMLSSGKIKEMRGEINFLHRMKIALIEESFSKTTDVLLYADSDTFFTADPTPVTELVSEDTALMHQWEYKFESMKDWPMPAGETFRAFYQLIISQSFTLSNGESTTISPQLSSWNAGVMFFHPTHRRFIPDVYALTQQLYPPTQNHASEQYAFSIILQQNITLKACNEVIEHYWYPIKKQVIDLFLKKRVNEQWSKKSLQGRLSDTYNWIKILPHYFEQHILMIKDKSIQAFNTNDFKNGYKWASKALLKKPGDIQFIKDILYHTKKKLKS
jgi:hypothetical protein